MEENKKLVPLMSAHCLLLAIALIASIISLFTPNQLSLGAEPLSILCTILCTLALGTGCIYLSLGYKKSAAIFYKIYMGLMTIEAMFRVVYAMLIGIDNFWEGLLWAAPLVIIAILATAKDFGHKKTYILVAILVVLRIVFLISAIIKANVQNMAPVLTFGVIVQAATYLILAITIGLMVAGKYMDKAQRGRD